MIWRLIRAAFRRFAPGVYRDAVQRVAAEKGLTPEQLERKVGPPVTVQPPEQPIPRDPDVHPCAHPVRDSDTGLCAVCGVPLPPERKDRP